MARRGNLSHLRTADSLAAAGVGYPRCERTNRAALGNHVPLSANLAKLDADLTAGLTPCPAFTVPGLDVLPVVTIVVIVIDVPVLGRVFRRAGMIGWDFHNDLLLFCSPHGLS